MGYLIILPILILITPAVFSQQSPLLKKICTNASSHSRDYADDSPYAKNVKVLLDDLFKNTPNNQYLFSNESLSGQDPRDPTIYGLALCRGDVSCDECDYCLYDARCKITQRCNQTSAIVWYDYCQVKYSDVNFFGKFNPNSEKVILYNVNNVTGNQTEFQNKSIGLLGNLSIQASDKSNKHMFAGGDTVFKFNQTSNMTIYGMAQCTLDLSPTTCKTCLDCAIEKLPIYHGPEERFSEGGRVLGESCAVRYEIYYFLNDHKKMKA